jgi:hypothetical protein
LWATVKTLLSHGTKAKTHGTKAKTHGTKEKTRGTKEKTHGTKEKTHGTKEKTHGTKEKLTAQEHIFSMRGLETDLKQSNKHGGLNKILCRNFVQIAGKKFI